MVKLWVYRNFTEVIRESFKGRMEIDDPHINKDSFRLTNKDGTLLLPFKIISPSQDVQYEHVIVTKDKVKHYGFLLDLNEHYAIIRNNDGEKVIIRHYDNIVYPMRRNLYPYLETLNQEPTSILRYQTSSLTWICRGEIILDQDSILLRIYAVINNKREIKDDVQEIILVSQPSFFSPKTSLMRAAASSMSSSSSSPTMRDETPSSFEDYLTFQLRQYKLPLGVFNIPLLNLHLKTRKFYCYSLETGKSNLILTYEFTTSQDIPYCFVDVHDEEGLFISSNEIKETRKDEVVRLYLAETSLIVSETQVSLQSIPLEDNQGFLSQTKAQFISYVSNHKETDEIVVARYYVGNKKVSSISFMGNHNNDDDDVWLSQGYLNFAYSLPGQSEIKLEGSFILEA